eukprot:TRINITY_DN3238_c0_g2_i1.p1 TRINITY_DN3238_c0_g2~~TRINITY_DN3238_c0_g2_i1.p1  ORF type:complete len:560 (+),score=173.41 TRINITY_DN3238_c0_g2_i1:182-1861(+)
MLSLSFKTGERLALFDPLMNKIKSMAGEEVALRLESTIRLMEELRESLRREEQLVEDVENLRQAAGRAKLYLSMWTSVCQDFAFGKEQGCLNLNFIWTDSRTGRVISSDDPLSERFSVFYNLGVTYNQLGISLAAKSANYEEAAKQFLVAAWAFEELGVEVCKYQADELGVDLSRHNLLVCSELMKAQAQYCEHKKVHLAGSTNYALLSKLAMQASRHYSTAHTYASLPFISKSVSKDFANILQFNKHSFMSQAYFWKCNEYLAKGRQKGSSIGVALANITKAIECLASLDVVRNLLPPLVIEQCEKLLAEYQSIALKLEKENINVYHEEVPLSANEIDSVVCGRPISIESELNAPFDGQAILARMSPVQAKTLEEEYKNTIGAIIAKAFKLIKKVNTDRKEIFKQFSLPATFYALYRGQELPRNLWEKIKYCKELNSTSSLTDLLKQILVLSKSNAEYLHKFKQQIEQEENEDKMLREQYGDLWKREPSTNTNRSIKTQLGYYETALVQGMKTDAKLKSVIEKCADKLVLLDKNKTELTGMMPVDGSKESEMPSIVIR